MPRVRGMHGKGLDDAMERVESLVVRVLRGIARTVASLVGGSPSAAALSEDDLHVIRRDWEHAVTVEIVPKLAEAYVSSARVLADEFADAGRDVDPLDLHAPETADFLDAATNRLVGVSDTLWDVARKELADGIRAGEGIEELATRLQEAGGFGEARARMIARTEVVAAANAASLAQALRLGDPSMVKEWLDSDDDRVRQAHEFADGQTLPLGEPFEVGGEFLMYPGQPIGSPGNVINERCTLGYSWNDPDEPLTAAAEVHTGAMVALRPSLEDAKRLAVDGGEPADQLHCTLAYLGMAADIPAEVQQAIIDRLKSLVEDAIRPDHDLPLMAEGFAVSMFNPPGAVQADGKDRDSCVVLGLSGGDLDSVHGMVAESLAEVFSAAGLEMPEQHAPWNAHVTLEYTEDIGRPEALMDRAGPVTFDAIRVAFGGEITDTPLAPISGSDVQVAAAETGATDVLPVEHLAGVDLADSGLQVDSWADGTFSIADPQGAGFWLDEDEANDLIDALNQVRGGGEPATVTTADAVLEVGQDNAGTVTIVMQGAPDGWALTDNDAYDLSYWLAYWLDQGGYYDGVDADPEPAAEEPLTAARRLWDPLKHPRGPDGRFIGKGIVGRASGQATSKATRREDAPASVPPRPAAPSDPKRAELSNLRVVDLRQRARAQGLTPGRARKAELVEMIAAKEGSPESAPAAPAQPADPMAGFEELLRSDLGRRSPGELRGIAAARDVPVDDVPNEQLVDAIVNAILNPAAATEPQAPAPAPATPEQRIVAAKADIRDVVEKLGGEPGAYIMLDRVRDELGDRYSRDEVDQALIDLSTDPDILILPEANQKALTPQEREAAVMIGNQPNHIIQIIPEQNVPDHQLTRAELRRELEAVEEAGNEERAEQIREELRRRELTASAVPPVEGDQAEPVADWDDYFANRLAEFVASDANLREYWTHGEGAAKIRWGTDGDFDRCVRHLREYVRDPEGLCAEYHREALGKTPGEHAAIEEAFAGVAAGTDEVASDADPLEPLPGEHFHTWVLEGVSTGLRQFAVGAITWRTPPFAYHWQWKSSAHNGLPETVQTGLVTRAFRDDNNVVHFFGKLDLKSAEGLDYARRVAEGWARWSSVGADESLKDGNIDVEYVMADVPEPAEDPEIDLMTFRDYRVAEITGVSVPALADALVEPTQELVDALTAMGVIEPAKGGEEPADELPEETMGDLAAVRSDDTPALDSHGPAVVVAAGHTITLPDAPPAAWFDEPADDELPPYGSVRVDANGRLIGLLAPAEVNHRSFPGKRVKVPMGNVDYSGWQNKSWPTADGRTINVGVITMNCGHASTNPGDWSYTHRREHYDNTCSIAAHARAYEKPGIGVALAGAIAPWLDAEGFGKLLSSDLSGDWPPHPDRAGWRDFIAALAVPVGGFANRARLRVAEGALVAAAVPVQFNDMEIPMEMEEAPLLAEGTPVRVLDPRDPEVTEGEIVVVHDGPAYALMVPGRDEPVRWYVAEELEPADPMAVAEPEAAVEVEEIVASAAPDLQPALDFVARTLGRDPASRMAALRDRVHPGV